MKMRGFREKAILRAAVRDLLPAEIVRRRKKPFMTPIGPWFFGAGAPAFVGEALSREAVADAGLFDPVSVARLRAALDEAPPNHVERFRRELLLMLVLGTQLLARQFVHGVGVPQSRFALKSAKA
jgi:asparagine synthase (glutamine-hydrolysing)